MMTIDAENGIQTADGRFHIAVGTGPCCQGSFAVGIVEPPPAGGRDLPAMASLKVNLAQLIELGAIIERLVLQAKAVPGQVT